MEEMSDIEELLKTQDAAFAQERVNSSFPTLRELANFIANGGMLPRPPGELTLFSSTSFVFNNFFVTPQ